jgi:GntR family transcriptional regulator
MANDAKKGKFPEEYQRTVPLVSRHSRLPLYQQIYELLRSKILNGTWNVGDMLPTEFELMEEYGVSRVTIRQVFDRLGSEGLIYRQQGRGTFVAKPTLEQGLTRIISFTEDMHRRGLVPATKVLAAELIPAVKEVAEVLKIDAGENVAYIKRLRIANGEPMCIEESHLPHKLCEGILDYDFANQPLREVLDKQYNIRIVRALQKIHACVATRRNGQIVGDFIPVSAVIHRTGFF